MVFEPFRRGGADGRHDDFPAGLSKRFYGMGALRQLHDVIDLGGIRNHHRVHRPFEHFPDRRFNRCGVFRKRPAIDGH